MAQLILSLVTLRAEFNQLNPQRDKRSDGWIGNTAHAATVSDHNPAADGDVHAIDVDKDGVNMNAVVAHLVARCKSGAEKRLKYIIWNRTIWSASWGWTAKQYTGANPHTEHAHFSGSYDPVLERNTASWGVAALGKPVVKPPAPRLKPTTNAPGSRTLRLVSPQLKGEDVKFVQRWTGATVDGVYGPGTRARVERWQRLTKRLQVDGVVGPASWRFMGVKAR